MRAIVWPDGLYRCPSKGEIGVRLARGAHIAWLVFRETFYLAMAGIAAGLPVGLWAARYAKSLLFEVSGTDPVTIAVIIVALIAVAAPHIFRCAVPFVWTR
jgi:hypothetical protein